MKMCSMPNGWTETTTVRCKGNHIHHMLLKHRPITGIFRSPYHLSVLLLLGFRAPPGTSTNRWVRKGPPKPNLNLNPPSWEHAKHCFACYRAGESPATMFFIGFFRRLSTLLIVHSLVLYDT